MDRGSQANTTFTNSLHLADFGPTRVVVLTTKIWTEESMQLRSLSARYPVLITLLIALVHALLLHASELRAEEPSTPSAPGPATPLAAALGVRFVDGSTSSMILERDGKEYVVDLATQSIREKDPQPQIARAEPQQGAAASTAGTSSGASLFRQHCATC